MITDLELINLGKTKLRINLNGYEIGSAMIAYTNRELKFNTVSDRTTGKDTGIAIAPAGTKIRIGQVSRSDYTIAGRVFINDSVVYFSTISDRTFIEQNMYQISSKVNKIEIDYDRF